jgi:hypothetical protein
MLTSKQKLAQPVFIASVVLLIINDWFLKAVFHNVYTGKISDFTGLFAFPFFLSALLPQWKKLLHILTAVFFIFWKTELSQPLINLLNSVNLPVSRTVDFTDNIALVSIIISYQIFTQKSDHNAKPFLIRSITVIACLAFMATSMPQGEKRKFVDINKEYRFNFSKRELVSRLNMVQLKDVIQINKFSGAIDFDSKTNAFHFTGQKDTLALILDYEKINDADTIRYKTSYAEIMILGNDKNSALKLVSIYHFIPAYKKKDFKDKAIRQFEQWVVKKIRKAAKKNINRTL